MAHHGTLSYGERVLECFFCASDLIVDNESGILVPSGSAEKIAEAMRSLMDDRTKLQKLAKASRERIINEFSVEAYVSYFDKLFASLS